MADIILIYYWRINYVNKKDRHKKSFTSKVKPVEDNGVEPMTFPQLCGTL
jgi:hypothetical protein